MKNKLKKIAILGQGLIGSSITRAIYLRNIQSDLVITDTSATVRERLLELGLGHAKVVPTNVEAVEGADLVIGCVPVAAFGALVQEIAPHMKAGSILSDVGSVKANVVKESMQYIPETVSFIPAHPLAGTEFSGPDAGKSKLFIEKWCILTPPENTDSDSVETVREFWESLGSKVEVMTPEKHDYALAITSHLPHLSAFSIFHTALHREELDQSAVIQFSAGAFRDFTRIASSNPSMWRDIFLMNKEPILSALDQFVSDMGKFSDAIRKDDGEALEKLISKSRVTRKSNIIDEDKAKIKEILNKNARNEIFKPYSSD